LCTIIGCNLAVVNGSYAAVRSLRTRRISSSSVEIAHRGIARFGISVAPLGRDLALMRSQPGLPTASCGQLIASGVLAIFGCLCTIICGNLAVVDGLCAAICSHGAPRVGTGPFVCSAPAVARSAISGAAVEITGRVVSRLGFSVTLLGRDVTLPRSQTGLATACGRQLVGPGVLPVLGRLCAIVSCNLAVGDGAHAAVGRLGAPRVGPGPFVCRASAVARGTIPSGSVEISSSIVTRLGLSVTQLGREVTRARSQPGILAVLGRLRTVLGSKLAVVDGLGAVVRRLGATRGGLGTFVRGILSVARRAISSGSVEITRRVVTRLGLSVTQPGRDVTILRSLPRLPTAHARQLVGSGIFTVLRGLCAILGCNLTVVYGLGSVVRSPRSARFGLGAVICRMLTVAFRTVPCGSVEITRRVVTRFGLSVTQPGGDVTTVRSQSGLTTAHSCQLVGSGILAVLGGLRAIFGSNLAVIDGLHAVVRSPRSARRSLGALASLIQMVARRTIPCRSVKIACRVVTRFRLSVTLLSLSITNICSQIAVTPF
jgi:hypothetical protein